MVVFWGYYYYDWRALLLPHHSHCLVLLRDPLLDWPNPFCGRYHSCLPRPYCLCYRHCHFHRHSWTMMPSKLNRSIWGGCYRGSYRPSSFCLFVCLFTGRYRHNPQFCVSLPEKQKHVLRVTHHNMGEKGKKKNSSGTNQHARKPKKKSGTARGGWRQTWNVRRASHHDRTRKRYRAIHTDRPTGR